MISVKVIEETYLVNKIKVVPSGKEAFDFLNATYEHPDLLPEIILFDLNMPIMDGWRFLEAYIKLKPHFGKKIAIYVVSSSLFEWMIGYGFFAKPLC